MRFRTVKFEALQEELVEAYDLTVPLEGTVHAYGTKPTEFRESALTPDDLQYMTALNLYPSAVGNLTGKPISLHTLVSHNCVLVDISCYVSVLERAKKLSFVTRLADVNQYCWEKGQLQEILEELRLSEDKVKWLSFARGAAIIFRTGWSCFSPAGRLLSDSWIPWHPYYLHPYLDEDAVSYLTDTEHGLGVRGIGCDIYNLESPLAGLETAGIPDSHSDVDEAIRSLQIPRGSGQQTGNLATPVKDIALSNGAWTGGHFHVPVNLVRHSAQVKCQQVANMKFLYREGRLLVTFLGFRSRSAPVLAKAYFAPYEGER